MAVVTGVLALSMAACAAPGDSSGGIGRNGYTAEEVKQFGTAVPADEVTPVETEVKEWESITQPPQQFLTDDERRIFTEFLGEGNPAIWTQIEPVAFMAEQFVDGKPNAYAFLTQNTAEGEVTWNVVSVYPNEINPDTNKPQQNIDFIIPDTLYVSDTWEGVEGSSSPGWVQHVADMSNAPKLEDLTRQKIIDDYFAAGIGGQRATFGPLGTRNKAGIRSTIYLVENQVENNAPVWMFVTLDEGVEGNVVVGSCQNMDIRRYLGIGD